MFTEITGTTKSAMLTKFQTILDKKFPFLNTAELYLAISGGKDSMTLSHLLTECGIKHVLLHCNFQLRGKESDQDEQFLRDYAAKKQLEIHVKNFDTANIAEQESLSIQECARKLRYDWFRTFIEKKDNAFLVTAHHLDDSIETFFINLLRGTGFRGLSGIPVNANQIVRPLSDFTAEEIYRYIDAVHLDYRSDSSNAKKDYLRNKIRHDLIPVLADIDTDFRNKFVNLFGELSDLKEKIDEEIAVFKNQYERIRDEKLIYSIPGIQTCTRLFIEQLFRSVGVYRKNSAEFLNFLSASTGSRFYTDTHSFLIDRLDLIVIPKKHDEETFYKKISELKNKIILPDTNISLELKTNFKLNTKNPEIQQVDFSKVELPLTIRTWAQGDKIKPLGMNGTKLISDILINKKINLIDKEKQLVIVDSKNELLCLVGLVISEDYKIQSHTREILEVVVSK